MRAEGTRLAVAAGLLIGLLGGASCAFDLGRGGAEVAAGGGTAESVAPAAADPFGPEEVLEEEEDEFGVAREKRPETVAGELLVIVGYIGMIVAGTILPLLLL